MLLWQYLIFLNIWWSKEVHKNFHHFLLQNMEPTRSTGTDKLFQFLMVMLPNYEGQWKATAVKWAVNDLWIVPSWSKMRLTRFNFEGMRQFFLIFLNENYPILTKILSTMQNKKCLALSQLNNWTINLKFPDFSLLYLYNVIRPRELYCDVTLGPQSSTKAWINTGLWVTGVASETVAASETEEGYGSN